MGEDYFSKFNDIWGSLNDDVFFESIRAKSKDISYNDSDNFDILYNELSESKIESLNEKNSVIKEKYASAFDKKDIHQVLTRVDEEIESISEIDEDAKNLIRLMRNGKRYRYRIFLWYLEGSLDATELMKRYDSYCNEFSALRTVFIIQGLTKPAKIVLKREHNVFPITSLIGLSDERQTLLIKNIIAAEIRREYDIEKDSILKIQAYEISKNRIAVIFSMFPFQGMDFGGIRNLLFKVFDGFKTTEGNIQSVDDLYIQKMNKSIRNKSKAYWSSILKGLPLQVRYPYQNSDVFLIEKESEYYSLDRSTRDNLMEYSKRSNIDPSVIMIKAWGTLLCRYNEEVRVAIGVVNEGELLNIFPIVFEEGMHTEDIGEQIKASYINSECTIEDLDEIARFPAKEYYKVIHNFVDFSIIEDAVSHKKNGELLMFSYGDIDKIDPSLVINYYFFNENINLNYIYKKGTFLNNDVSKLNDMFIETLEELMYLKKSSYKEENIVASRSPEVNNEEQKKIMFLRRALLLKQTGMFDKLSTDVLMDFSSKCTQSRFSKNDEIISDISKNDSIFFITEGTVQIRKVELDGRVKPIILLKKGDIFGVESMFRSNEKNARYIYVAYSNQVQIIAAPSNLIDETGEHYPDFYRQIIRKLLVFINDIFSIESDYKF